MFSEQRTEMKFQFKEQDYQVRAVESIADVFAGQPFRQSEELKGHLGACSLDVEMETGTGKTYVYIRTMFELNKRYGWSKFIVVVPSVAIREGVANSFDLTEEHFFGIYGKKIRRFIYNSKDLGLLDDFAADKDIYCMIINAQAFAASLKEGARNEAARIIYSLQDMFSTRRPIDVIAATRPIIILDEPQKLGGAATQASLQRFRPLFTVNFSATHKEAHNLVYVLDALDAYNMKLVKQIEVKGLELRNLRGTDGFVCLNQIMASAGKPPVARLSFEVNRAGGVSRETRLCGVGYDLYKNSAGKGMSSLEKYREGYVVKDIDAAADSVTFMNGDEQLAQERLVLRLRRERAPGPLLRIQLPAEPLAYHVGSVHSSPGREESNLQTMETAVDSPETPRASRQGEAHFTEKITL